MQAEKDELPVLPTPATHAYVQGPAYQGGEYRLLADSYEPNCAMYSPDQMHAYAREHAAELQREVEGLRGAVERERQRCYDIVMLAPYEQGDPDASEWPSPEAAIEVALKSMAFHIITRIRSGAAIDRSLSGGEGGGNG